MDPNLDFRDLGPIGLSILQDINQRFLNKLYTINSVTNIGCIINIDQIFFHSQGSCLLHIENSCVNNNETAFTLLLNSLYEVLTLLPEDRRELILSQLGMTMNDIKNERNVGFINDCSAYAEVHNSIDIGNFYVPSCSSSSATNLTTFTFVNSGSVKANCGISEISGGLVFNDDVQEIQDKYIHTIFGYDYYHLILFIFTIIIISLFLVIFLYLVLQKPKYNIFVSRNDLSTFDKSIYIRDPIEKYAYI